jgi:hypothetical protein
MLEPDQPTSGDVDCAPTHYLPSLSLSLSLSQWYRQSVERATEFRDFAGKASGYISLVTLELAAADANDASRSSSMVDLASSSKFLALLLQALSAIKDALTHANSPQAFGRQHSSLRQELERLVVRIRGILAIHKRRDTTKLASQSLTLTVQDELDEAVAHMAELVTKIWPTSALATTQHQRHVPAVVVTNAPPTPSI